MKLRNRTIRTVRTVLAVVIIGAGAAAQFSAGPAGAAAKHSAQAGAPTCGGTTLAKPSGGTWVCTADDEFNGPSLSTTMWSAVDTATTGVRGGQECSTPANLQVTGGDLVLTATKAPARFACGKYMTRYSAAMIWSRGVFTQTYGRYEIRARFAAGRGLHGALWMLPQNPLANGRSGYEYGEIDIAEAYGLYPAIVSPHLHYVSTPGTTSGGKNCTVTTANSDFHTYAVEWTPTRMTFLYDGSVCWDTTWKPKYRYSPLGSRMPVPFDQPFYIIVQLAIDTNRNRPNARTVFPASMYVDYVRVWK